MTVMEKVVELGRKQDKLFMLHKRNINHEEQRILKMEISEILEELNKTNE